MRGSQFELVKGFPFKTTRFVLMYANTCESDVLSSESRANNIMLVEEIHAFTLHVVVTNQSEARGSEGPMHAFTFTLGCH